jgi:branched-chain amino acid transport system ATP-binding protein
MAYKAADLSPCGERSSLPPMLELNRLSIRFGGLQVIDDLDLVVQRGEILGVLGPNGAGKSTLFNLVAGSLEPDAGAIMFRGRDVSDMKLWDRRRVGIGRTYQIPKPFTHMSVFENVLVAAVHGGGAPIRQARREAAELLEMTGLASRSGVTAGQLSLLDLKRLELAKALAGKPDLLLLDEIAGGLTEAECGELLDLLTEIHCGGATIIWVEHVLHALRRVATRLAVLFSGSIIAEGAPEAILADERVKEIYLGA